MTTFGRPGTANIIKRRSSIKSTLSEEEYDKKNANVFNVLTKMKEIDSERGISLVNKAMLGNYSCKSYNSSARPYIDTLLFKPVKETQVSKSNLTG